jgi:hypothetical protein
MMKTHVKLTKYTIAAFVICCIVTAFVAITRCSVVKAEAPKDDADAAIQYSAATSNPTRTKDEVISAVSRCTGFSADQIAAADYVDVTQATHPFFRMVKRPVWKVTIQGDTLYSAMRKDKSVSTNTHIKKMTALYDEKGTILSLYSDIPAIDGIYFRGKLLAKHLHENWYTIQEPDNPPKSSFVSVLYSASSDGENLVAEATEIVAYHVVITNKISQPPLKNRPCWFIVVGGINPPAVHGFPGFADNDDMFSKYCDALIIADSDTGRIISYERFRPYRK